MFEGLVLVDKPKGITSHDVVGKIRKALNTKRVGHAGTLDPLATGLLIVLVGRATRLSDYLLTQSKSYRVTVELGRETDTLDADGKTTKVFSGPLPSEEEIVETVISTRGLLELPIPQYSAVKVDGKKLYEYARKGESIGTIYREMLFESVDLQSVSASSFVADIKCSKGSFIRAWAAEVGRRLGCGGVVCELRRLSSGLYSVDEAVALEDLKAGEKGFVALGASLRGTAHYKLMHDEVRTMLSGRIPGSVIRQNQLGGLAGHLVSVVDPEEQLLAVLHRTDLGRISIGCVLPPLDA